MSLRNPARIIKAKEKIESSAAVEVGRDFIVVVYTRDKSGTKDRVTGAGLALVITVLSIRFFISNDRIIARPPVVDEFIEKRHSLKFVRKPIYYFYYHYSFIQLFYYYFFVCAFRNSAAIIIR